MSHPFFSRFKSRTGIVIILLLITIIALPFLFRYFGSFYSSSYADYKKWYPNLYFIAYPVVKSLPFAFLFLLIWLLYNAARNSIQNQLTKTTMPPQIPGWRDKKKIKQLLMNGLVLLISTTIILGITELGLRKAGMKPGQRSPNAYFKPVDSLYSLKAFMADSNGIFCIDPDAREFIRNEIKTKNRPEELLPLNRYQSTEVYTLARDFVELRKSDYQSDFKTFLQSLDTATDTADRELFAAIKNYASCPINTNGFKSIEFKKYSSKKKSVLLLGDSFTWGHTCKNKTNCFADFLLTKGYVIYNAGITGTDPAQYLQLAKVLVPLLQPDYVVVNFYMGNDIIYFERKPEPYVPVFYCTNAGNLISCPQGIYFYSAQATYDYTLSIFTIPTKKSQFNRFCSKTSVGTLCWRALATFNLVNHPSVEDIEYYERVTALTTETPYSDVQLKQTKEIAEQYGAKFLLVAIPLIDGKDFIFPKDKQPLFTGLEYFVPPVQLPYYEQKEDGHYNDLGHKMHGEFIDSLIRNNAGTK